MIKITKLSKSFKSKPVLTNLDLHIRRGETLVIIGQSGGGKSVLLKNIIGLLKPDAGCIEIAGVDIVPLSDKQMIPIRKRCGLLFQGAALFDSLTVWENVAFGIIEHKLMSTDKAKVKVRELLSLIGLEGIENIKPAELSGGMRKRVGLARAIAMDPEIIFYDEPTTGLDPIMGDVINNLILKMRDRYKATSIAVTHDMASAYKIADRIAMLYNGQIIEIGTPDEIRNSKNAILRQFITGSADGPIKFDRGRNG